MAVYKIQLDFEIEADSPTKAYEQFFDWDDMEFLDAASDAQRRIIEPVEEE